MRPTSGQSQHFRTAPRCLDLRQVEQIRGEAYYVATPVARGEISPSASAHIYREATRMPVGTARVPRDELLSKLPAIRQPAREQLRQISQCGGVYRAEVNIR